MNLNSINYGKRILFIGAHSDDVEIGCGGIAAKLHSQGCQIAFVTATDCGETRKEETKRAASLLGLEESKKTLFIGEVRDGKLNENTEMLSIWLRKIKDAFNPTTVFCHHQNDNHADHKTLFDISTRVFAGRNLIQFYIPKMKMQQSSFISNIAEDISDFIDKKIELCKCHETQKEKDVYLSHIKERAKIDYTEAYGRSKGYAEVFIATFIASPQLEHKKNILLDHDHKDQFDILTKIKRNLKKCKYFSVYPVIDVKNPNNRLLFNINNLLPDIKTAVVQPETAIDEIMKKHDNNMASECYNRKYKEYLNRYNAGNFQNKENGLIDLNCIDRYEQYLKIVSDKIKFKNIKNIILKNYLERDNGFHFNGEKFALDNFIYSRDMKECEEFIFELRKTDYYTYRVISEFSHDMIHLHGFHEKISNGLLEYMGNNLQKNIHLGVSVSVLVHCIEDDSVILTRRSAYTANPSGEAGLYFISANEAINAIDSSTSNSNKLNIYNVIKRALREEIIGISCYNDNYLDDLIARCCFTGAFLYLPNMSISLCFYVSIYSSAENVRANYKYARDSRFEHSRIIDDRKWDAHTGLPSFSTKNMYNFLQYTIGEKNICEVWDEGAVVAFAQATLVDK